MKNTFCSYYWCSRSRRWLSPGVRVNRKTNQSPFRLSLPIRKGTSPMSPSWHSRTKWKNLARVRLKSRYSIPDRWEGKRTPYRLLNLAPLRLSPADFCLSACSLRTTLSSMISMCSKILISLRPHGTRSRDRACGISLSTTTCVPWESTKEVSVSWRRTCPSTSLKMPRA